MAKTGSFIGIIPARMESTRLPGKVMREVKGKPLIGYLVERANRIPNLKSIIIATTQSLADDSLCNYADKLGVGVYRGDTNDVSRRILDCATEHGSDYFVRLNGDSPFADPELIAQGMAYCSDGQVDFVTNLIGRTFPYGISIEILKTETFKQAYEKMTALPHKEHVTSYYYLNSSEFRIASIGSQCPELKSARMVVDTLSDFEAFKFVAQRLGDRVCDASFKEVALIYLAMNHICDIS